MLNKMCCTPLDGAQMTMFINVDAMRETRKENIYGRITERDNWHTRKQILAQLHIDRHSADLNNK